MTHHNHYDTAAKLIQEGDLVSARRILAQLLHTNPDDLAAWLLLTECVENDQQRKDCEEQIQRLSIQAEPVNDSETTPYDEVELLEPHKNNPGKYRRGFLRLAWLSLFLLLIGLGAALVIILSQGLPTWASDVLADIPKVPSNTPMDDTTQVESLSPVSEKTIEEIAPESQPTAAENYEIHLPGLQKSHPIEDALPVQVVEQTTPADGRGDPKKWKSWPVVPFVSQHAVEVYLQGIEKGTDPHAFSLLGDCHSEPYIMFERFADHLYQEDAEYKEYRKTLKYFQNSWNRYFITVANGMTVASAFSPAWAQHSTCKAGESPLDCEFRINNPSILLISLGTNWGWRDPVEFEKYLRKIVEYALERDVLPVIATKGDPAGPNNPLNEVMVGVAYEYDIPLWNFWAAIQELPNHGLNPWDGLGGVHLAPDAWPVKRNTGLMALDAIRKAVSGE